MRGLSYTQGPPSLPFFFDSRLDSVIGEALSGDESRFYAIARGFNHIEIVETEREAVRRADACSEPWWDSEVRFVEIAL